MNTRPNPYPCVDFYFITFKVTGPINPDLISPLYIVGTVV